jgi:hypothetical protein
MAELFTSELARFQGYRCVCGKQVAKDEEDIYRKPRMFMCCQGKIYFNLQTSASTNSYLF